MVPHKIYGTPYSSTHQNDCKTVIYTMRWFDRTHLWVLEELCVNLSLGCVYKEICLLKGSRNGRGRGGHSTEPNPYSKVNYRIKGLSMSIDEQTTIIMMAMAVSSTLIACSYFIHSLPGAKGLPSPYGPHTYARKVSTST
jgi:hypothetical protein